ncbi:MAG: hypothetical protein AAF432_14325 [Planctomycetota bacterium]
MSVFNAILMDSYRQLRSMFLFWIVLGLSFFVIVFYASIGFNEDGMFLFFGLVSPESQMLSEDSPLSSLLYRAIFTTFIVGLWLAWIATILALISTANIFPDFMASGAIDIVLAKPVRRTTLFIYKYLASLMFVVLQVTIFCVGVFICMGWRIGEWDPKIFVAIPVVTLFYSYLFSVCVLIGVRTRSVLVALLLTFGLWFSVFGFNTAEGIMLQIRSSAQIEVEDADEQIADLQAQLDELTDEADNADVAKATLQDAIDGHLLSTNGQRELLDKTQPWFNFIRVCKWVLPKTQETINLVNRSLVKPDAVTMNDIMMGNLDTNEDGDIVKARNDTDVQMVSRVQEFYDTQSLWYVIGTSLIFEFLVLALACWMFVRRDF